MIPEGKKRKGEGVNKCLFIWKILEFWEVTDVLSGFGGLEVACWPLVPQVRGFKPGRSRRIFQGEKKSSARLSSEGN